MIRILKPDAVNSPVRDPVNFRVGEAQEHRGMRRDNELGIVLYQLIHFLHQADDAPGRQRRLRLIQDIQPFSAEPVLRQRQEALPVGLPVEGYAAVTADHTAAGPRFPVHPVNICRDVVEAFGAQKVAV